MAMPIRRSKPGFPLLLSLAFILLLAAGAHAVECGTFHAGTGTCSTPSGAATKTVYCSTMLSQGEECCEDVSNCGWSEKFEGSGDFYCKQSSGVHIVTCSDYTDNEVGCKAMDCVWAATGAEACTGTSSGAGYGESCAGGCAKCLVCDNGPDPKCTQRPGICTTSPAIYVMPPPSSESTYGNENPQNAIASLESGAGTAVIGSSSKIYKVGWFSDWKAMGLIGVAIVCSIIALAALIGKAFNLPEIKAFANNEIKQAVISVLLIASLIALVAFFDEIAFLSIQDAGLPVDCNVPEPCYVAAAKTYLTTIIDIGKEYSKDNMKESIEKMRRSSYGYNINANLIYLAYMGFSIRFNAGDSLVAERHGALFSQTSKILTSLTAQRYFIDVVAFGIAPLFLLLGIVLRTFFFTRKLGGLLLAIAISLFIIYPLTYAFAWYTLNVTVYGERTLAVADPFCPGECTATYPAAFFSDPTTGELVQFPTTQSIVQSGIKSSNWALGGPDLDRDWQPDFPGLVACKDLSAIGLPNSGATANACPDCPDYCRDVPFPTSMPGCNITKCASCNPGCKIVRQRLNCQTDPDCAGKCPEICRTRVPTENKCFNNESGGVIPANLSVSCGGCSKYPAWCLFLREEPVGTYTRVYNDTNLNAACTGVDSDPACPKECSYITRIGEDVSCDAICSVEDPSSGMATVCPAECRVDKILENPDGWMGVYDIDPPSFASICASSPEVIAACNICKSHPECLAVVPDDPPSNCAAYPTNIEEPELCLECPDYCRRLNFTGYFTSASTVPLASNGFPSSCISPLINCSTTGSPPACNASCRTTEIPPTCRPFEASHDFDPTLCRGCPDNARYKVRYIKDEPAYSCLPNGTANYTAGVAPAGEYSIILSGTASPAGGAILPAITAGSGNENGNSGTIMLAGAGKYNSGTIWLDIVTTTLSARINPNESAVAGSPLEGWCKGTANQGQQGGAIDRSEGAYFMGGSKHVYWLDGLSIKYNFNWYRNGTLNATGTTDEFPTSGVDVLASTIPGANTSTGDTWTFSCRAYHSASSYGAWLNSSNVSIVATAVPLTQSARIAPPIPYTSDVLKGYCNATYAANSSALLSYEYKWYKNGALNASGNASGTFLQGLEINPANMSSNNLSAGQNWTFSCRANYSGNYSEWLNSSSVSILAVPVPVTQNASILPSPSAYRNETLRGFCNATYANNSSALITYEYKWYVNGTANATGTFPSPVLQGVNTNIANVSSAELRKLQAWIFSCRASLNGNYSEWLNSTSTTIFNPPEPPCTITNSSINLTAGAYHCDNAACSESMCQANPLYVELPTQDDFIYCDDASVTECPYGCRVLNLEGYLAAGCSACSEMLADHPDCFVTQPAVPLCSEYIGNGPASCHSATCLPLTSQSECIFQSGCSWNAVGAYCDNSFCPSKSQAACTGQCLWAATSPYVKIDDRTLPFSDRSYCRQCPEQCRLDGYTGDCGVENNGDNEYVDCSLSACPATCRIPEPLSTAEPPNPSCIAYPEGGESCAGCPALCRRSSDLMSYVEGCPETSCQLSEDPSVGCMDECRLPDPPEKACEGCFDCPMDCTYYPAIRTDCGEICSDEALAGPVDISPNDFIKKLSGAQTSTDGVWTRQIGVLYVPAVVLPLFCIVIVVAFVRIFSPIMGGDIEIPGIGRII